MSVITTHIARSFTDSAVSPDVWNQLLAQGDTRRGELSWKAQRRWWQDHERPDKLLLVLVHRDGKPQAIAPLFVEGGMAINLCPVTQLDFVGDVSDPFVLDAMIQAVRSNIPDFWGLRLYFVPHISRTGKLLEQAAARLGLKCYMEDELPAPFIDIRGKSEAARACTNQKTMLRREKTLRREGTLDVKHFRSADDVLPQLEMFFEQHIGRWADTPTPSVFRNPAERESFTQRTRELAVMGCLRFSVLLWNGRPIAFHRGTCVEGHYKYGKASFAIDLAHYSPGTVLMRHLLLEAIDEGAHTFDFGVGDEGYKSRYATDVIRVQTWGLYPA